MGGGLGSSENGSGHLLPRLQVASPLPGPHAQLQAPQPHLALRLSSSSSPLSPHCLALALPLPVSSSLSPPPHTPGSRLLSPPFSPVFLPAWPLGIVKTTPSLATPHPSLGCPTTGPAIQHTCRHTYTHVLTCIQACTQHTDTCSHTYRQTRAHMQATFIHKHT